MKKRIYTFSIVTTICFFCTGCGLTNEISVKIYDENTTEVVTTETAPTQKIYVKKEPVDLLIKNVDIPLNVRAKPQHKSNLVCKIDNFYTSMYYYGDVQQGLGSDGQMHNWYKIYVDDKTEGWVRSDLVISQNANQPYPYESDNAGTDYIKFTNSNLNLRTQPTHYSELAGTITDCDTILHSCFGELPANGLGSDGQMHEWIKVIVNSRLQGWVRSDLIMPIAVNTWCDTVFVKNVSGKLNVRSSPTHNSDLLGSVASSDINLYYYGNFAQGLGSDNKLHTWLEILVSNDLKGWVRSDLVTPKA